MSKKPIGKTIICKKCQQELKALASMRQTRRKAIDRKPKERLITVCDRCLTANCWHGRHMCQDADIAGTLDLPVSALAALKREHPEAWGPGFWEGLGPKI